MIVATAVATITVVALVVVVVYFTEFHGYRYCDCCSEVYCLTLSQKVVMSC